jgi:hypothetical protein
MSYLVPYHLALNPDENVRYRAFILQAVADIPDDTYQLQEFFCSNPDCPCQEVLLQVLSLASNRFVACFRVSLDPLQPHTPRLDPSNDTVPYAQALLKEVANNLNSDPSFIFRLRSHYNQVKAVAADPSHPAYAELVRWANTGSPQPSPAKHRRMRHH